MKHKLFKPYVQGFPQLLQGAAGAPETPIKNLLPILNMIAEALLAAYAALAGPNDPAMLKVLQQRLLADGYNITAYVKDPRFEIFQVGGIRRSEKKLDLTDPKQHPYMSEGSIKASLRFMLEEGRWLDEAENRTGIRKEYVTALLNMESGFGRNTGNYPVINALVSNYMLYASAKAANDKTARENEKSREFFYGEIKELLKLVRKTGTKDVFQMKGSYAGAMGPAQFMPSSMAIYGVDLDGDGFDYAEMPDAIGSCANFLAKNGGRKNMREALRRYNNWGSFVEAVEMHANSIMHRPASVPGLSKKTLPRKTPQKGR